MNTIEHQRNIDKVKGVRVRFLDCNTGAERFGVVLDYCAPLCWEIQPDRGQRTFAEDRCVWAIDGRRLAEMV